MKSLDLDPGQVGAAIQVSVLPTLFGEKIVLRLLDKENLVFDMLRLIPPEVQSLFTKTSAAGN